MYLYLTGFPTEYTVDDWYSIFSPYGKVIDIKYNNNYWIIIFEHFRTATVAMTQLQGKIVCNVPLWFTDKCPDSPRINTDVHEVSITSLKLFIRGEVTLSNSSKLSIKPIEINVPVNY